MFTWRRLLHIVIILSTVCVAGYISVKGIVFAKDAIDAAGNFALNLPQPEITAQTGQSSKIYDRDGTFLYEIHGEIRRQNVKLEEVPVHVRDAFLAAEDKDFYSHAGFSPRRIIGALIADVQSGEAGQGGSTIPQQLARMLVLTQDKTISRKIKEVLISYLLTLRYSKDQIFERYLNEVSVGGNLVGLRTASEVYFQKAPQDLTIAEGATIAALINAPSNLSPYVNQEALQTRAQYVLDKMHENGLINKVQHDNAHEQTVQYSPNIEPIKFPYFVFYVRDLLFQKYGKEVIENGGFKVITTIDSRLEEMAEAVVKTQVEKNTSKWGASNASLISIDPKNGHILTMVGGHDFSKSEVNVCTSKRQPGSSIKPFIYVTAFESGYSPNTVILDAVHDFGNGYRPTNYGGGATGSWWTIREALVQSLNIPAVSAVQKLGVEKISSRLNDLGFGIDNPNSYGLSIGLGSAVVRPIDMANALGILANGGKKITPLAILTITDANGNIIENNTNFELSEQIIDANAAAMVADILSDYRTKARFYNQAWYDNYTIKNRPAAAKTGTSEGPKDVWTVGFTPSFVTVVWSGNNDGSVVNKKNGADGITIAAPIWHEFMVKALDGAPVEQFPKYKDFELDKDHKWIKAQ